MEGRPASNSPSPSRPAAGSKHHACQRTRCKRSGLDSKRSWPVDRPDCARVMRQQSLHFVQLWATVSAAVNMARIESDQRTSTSPGLLRLARAHPGRGIELEDQLDSCTSTITAPL
jgi:hypothetical protein